MPLVELKINLFVVVRILLGLLFVVSGGEKLLGPYQNFQYTIEQYQLLSLSAAGWVARILPWFEFLIGIFVVLGLMTRWALRGSLLMITAFMIVVGQAILREIPIDQCGCFGELIHLPLRSVLLMDSGLWIMTALLIICIETSARFSLDEYFSKS